MPISKYFGGHGEEVLRNMRKQYGEKHGEEVFYATANKTGQTAKDSKRLHIALDKVLNSHGSDLAHRLRMHGALDKMIHHFKG